MESISDAYRIGIIGSSEVDVKSLEYKNVVNKCLELVRCFSVEKMVLLSGGDDGFTRLIMQEFKNNGGTTIGFFPGYQEQHPHFSEEGVSIPIFTGLGYGMRDILMVRTTEAVISVGGGCGTLNELTNAYFYHKPMYTLANTGGWSQCLENKYMDDRKKVVLKAFDDPQELIKQLVLDVNKKRRLKKMVSSIIENKAK